ncbi:DUF421 domain-containing protein [Metabacillus sediminilitoris]|uniref:DUF421 domain-containing protein n=1 Tax=Metabacillus sediminilitoris TaxID=2567941 RepID=A0A4S4C2J0_9BACI|nr:DUF421 domain-containing protein [Metabacillus sediminilitoris]QGQ46108.1 DUF421 domain-containing protein [Metabacillus sediminilitoris]THF79792.1 DUF421 domain-containing protein [Metabacillus sediminilitoris]
MPEWLDVVVRSFLFIVVLFLITKILGKKQLTELSFFEYVTGITIGSIAGEVIMGLEGNMWHGVISILIFGAVPFFVGIISLKSKRFSDYVEGKGTIFIKDGKVMEDNLKKERYTADELLELLRRKDVFQVADVEFAVLEPTGDLSVLLKKENRPVTVKDLGLVTPNEKEPQTVIMDGEILDEPLANAGRNRRWLETELDKLNVSIENVYLAQVDTYGQLTVDLFDDKIKVASPQEIPLLLAMIKKCQADLELFSLATESEETKKMYHHNALKIEKVINKLTPYLKN